MAWGTTIATIVQESSAAWGPIRKYDPVEEKFVRQYAVFERIAEWGHSKSSAETRRDGIIQGEDLSLYTDVQVQRVGVSGQYWVVYVKETVTWKEE